MPPGLSEWAKAAAPGTTTSGDDSGLELSEAAAEAADGCRLPSALPHLACATQCYRFELAGFMSAQHAQQQASMPAVKDANK